MAYIRELPHGKWAVYDDNGKLVIITRDKRICQNYMDKQQTEKE